MAITSPTKGCLEVDDGICRIIDTAGVD